MSQKAHLKVMHPVANADEQIIALEPFILERDEQRRFVRLEISTPMQIRKIKDAGGAFWAGGERRVINGLLLNISAGGVLVEVDQPVCEGEIVCLRFTLQDVESLDSVLGLVKRTDDDGEGLLVGIEFVTREYLTDIFSRAEMELLDDKLADFDERVREVLNRYIHRTRTVPGNNGHGTR